ncbi:uncharacterized protein ACWYII_017492 [Salvelinus alpinus]
MRTVLKMTNAASLTLTPCVSHLTSQSLECALVDDGAWGRVRSYVPMTVTAPMMKNAATMDVGMTALHLTQFGSLTCLVKLCCPKAKPGVCPRRRWGVGTCAELCSNDSDCPNDEKCCHNGCGHDCIAPYTVSVLPKAGQCPLLLTVLPPHKGCVRDEDCPKDDKCCVFHSYALCVPPDFTKPGVCPRRRWGVGTCAELCSNDSDCPNDEKCCHNGCGHDCIAPYTVPVLPKAGQCPLLLTVLPPHKGCVRDEDCPKDDKCCVFDSDALCVPPDFIGFPDMSG